MTNKVSIDALGVMPHSTVMKTDNKERGGLSVKMTWLIDQFETVPEGIDGDELGKYVSGFALYIVGTVLLSTADNTYVSLQYLDCLSKDKIKKYAWGAAMLAHIHYSLKKYKLGKPKAIGSHLHLVMIWALFRFPKFAKELISEDVELPTLFPLSCSLTPLISKELEKKYKLKNINYQQHLETFGNDEVLFLYPFL